MHETPSRLSRRLFIRLVAVGAGAALGTACAAPAPPAQTGAAPTTETPGSAATRPASTVIPAAPATPAPTLATQPASTGATLRVGIGFTLPATLNYRRSAEDGGRSLVWGSGETLTRVTPDTKLEPWLAEKVENLDPRTWRVTLRPGVRFWDGSPLTARDVEVSLKESWEQPAASASISKDTSVAVLDERTLTLTTSEPLGDLPYSLATQFFVMHKRTGETIQLTGQFRPTRLDTDHAYELEAVPDYWGPKSSIKKVVVRLIADSNARGLALQSGDVDLLWRFAPRLSRDLGAEFEVLTRPAFRTNMVMFNHAKPPFDSVALREAMSLAIDRQVLLQAGYDGLSEIATGLFPKNIGVEVVDAQTTFSVERARKLLDEAGWQVGSDGVRTKGGEKLAFTLHTYKAFYDEHTPMAVAIQEQLRPLGFAVEVREVRNPTEQVKDGNFQACMWSLSVLNGGDPRYLFNVALMKDGLYNYGKYLNPKLEAMMPRFIAEADPAKRQALSREAQELVKDDYPYLYLNAAPMNAAFRKGKVTGFTLHPHDQYLMQPTIAVAG